MSAHRFRKHDARDAVLQLIPPEAYYYYQPFRKDFTYTYGRIELNIYFEHGHPLYPAWVTVVIHHKQGRSFEVLRLDFQGSECRATCFKDGEWVKALELIAADKGKPYNPLVHARVQKEDEDPWTPVKDDYLFPEYSGEELVLEDYPMAGGRSRRWREGWRGSNRRVIRIVKNHDKHGLEYEDHKMRLRRGHHSAYAYIRSPEAFWGDQWRCVLRCELHGQMYLTVRFKPGKWIYYIRDLANE